MNHSYLQDSSASGHEQRGVCVWLTGLSGAEKSTIAVGLIGALHDAAYAVMLVDGDALRRGRPVGPGFSKPDRDTNVLHAAAAARATLDRGEIAVCALISPYRETRAAARRLIGVDNFIEVLWTLRSVISSRRPGLKQRYSRSCLAMARPPHIVFAESSLVLVEQR